MKLIVNADDFGYSKGVNLGIIEAYRNGIVTSTTLMANMPGVEHAVELARQAPSLGVGIHLVLTCGRPVSPDVPSLVDQDGRFRKGQEQLEHATAADIERELISQVEKFYATGLEPTHLDSHHHVHAHEMVFPIVKRLAERLQLPLRRISMYPEHEELYGSVKTTQAFYPTFYGEQVSLETIASILEQSADYETAEMMCHPAYLDEAILEGSSYALPRAKELSILTDERVKQMIARTNCELVTYKEIL